MRSILLRQSEFARQVGMSESMVRRWTVAGRVLAVRVPGGEPLISSDQVGRMFATVRAHGGD